MFDQIFGFRLSRISAWREFALLAVLIMELSWITPWFLAILDSELSASIGTILIAFSMFGILTIFAARILANLKIDNTPRYGILALLLFVGALSANSFLLHPGEGLGLFENISTIVRGFESTESLLPNEFVLMFTLALIWQRAIRWAYSDAMPSDIRRGMRFSFLMFVIFLFSFVWRGEGSLEYFPYVFFLFALIASGSARIARSDTHPAAQIELFSRKWLLLLLAIFLIFTLIVIGFGTALDLNLEWFRQAAFSLWLLFWGIIILILSPLFFIIGNLFEWLLQRLNLQALQNFFPLSETAEEEGEGFEELVNSVVESVPFLESLRAWLASLPIAGFLAAARPYLFAASILALIGFGLFLAGRRISLWKALGKNFSIDTSNDESDWLNKLRGNWLNRLKDIRDSLLRIANLDTGRKLLAAARIRRVYSYLMDMSESLGEQRDRAITPLEFIPALDELFPYHGKEIQLISTAYVRVRYGEIDESPNEVIEVDRAWLQVRLEGERMKRKKRKKQRAARKKPTNSLRNP
jgi:hypothetical protein